MFNKLIISFTLLLFMHAFVLASDEEDSRKYCGDPLLDGVVKEIITTTDVHTERVTQETSIYTWEKDKKSCIKTIEHKADGIQWYNAATEIYYYELSANNKYLERRCKVLDETSISFFDYSYDKQDNLVKIVRVESDEDGKNKHVLDKVLYKYDENNRKISVEMYIENSNTPRYVDTFKYEQENEYEKTTRYLNRITSNAENITWIKRDNNNLILIHKWTKFESDKKSFSIETTYQYKANGQLLKTETIDTDFRSQITIIDASSKITKIPTVIKISTEYIYE